MTRTKEEDKRTRDIREGVAKIRWAAKVDPVKIRRLYQRDAQGIVDEDLIDEVAYGFYARCKSILTVTEASHGRIQCPVCDHLILHEGYDKDQVIRCPACDWAVTWGAYKRTYKEKQLHGGNAVDVFRDFVHRLPQTRSHREKMLLIDRIIHACHKSIKDEEVKYLRPVAVNLIKGSMKQVIDLLEELAYGPGSVPGSQGRQETWRTRVLRDVGHRERWVSE
jgi:ribosomal protein L37AE/L43A